MIVIQRTREVPVLPEVPLPSVIRIGALGMAHLHRMENA
jgi:hypothetical protein